MFAGFNLFVNDNFEGYQSYGEVIFQNNKVEAYKSLDQYFDVNGSIDGTTLQSDWFPQIECDIFLSHSHKDEEMAKGLAGWLNKTFGLTVFIDSCVWGYSLELQKKLDDEYCLIEKKNPGLYDYQKVMYSSSHVHMMLSTALTMMIDKAESVFLLNTPNVISTVNTITQTESPWIYHELAMTQFVRKKPLSEYRKLGFVKEGHFNESASASLNIKYKVETSHLYELNLNDLNVWATQFLLESSSRPAFADSNLYSLDILYTNKELFKEHRSGV